MLNQFARLGAFAGAVAIVLSSVLPAIAAPTIFRDSDNNVYVMGLQPQTRINLTYNEMMRGRDYQASPCGLITLRNTSTNPISGTISVGGTNVDTTTLPTQLLPACDNGTLQEARTANFKTTSGDVIIVGRTAGSYVTIQTPQDRDRSGTTNACGFVRFSNSTSYQHAAATNVTFGSTTSDIGQLTEKDAPLCSRGSLYVPASWLPGS
ncbi:MAG TPA: hypothetical protein V6C65_22700 [Allocoleopsis sp.]